MDEVYDAINEKPCYLCGGPQEHSNVILDLSPEGQGAHYPICMACLDHGPRQRVHPSEAAKSHSLPSRYKILTVRDLSLLMSPPMRGFRDG